MSRKTQAITDSPHRFFNRELSWLAFNTRVLEEADNPDVPLLERVRFLSICASNLDEFYMVRVAGLKEQCRDGITRPSVDGRTPEQQLDAIAEAALVLNARIQSCWLTLRDALTEEDITVVRPDTITKDELKWLKRYFTANIFPTLTPIAIDPAHPFPFIPNLQMAMLLRLKPDDRKKPMNAMVSVPASQERFITLEPGKQSDGKYRFISLEDCLLLCVESLFPNAKLLAHSPVRLIRDSDLDISDEAEDLVQHFEQALRERKRGQVVRVKVYEGIDEELHHLIITSLNARREDVFEVPGMLGMHAIDELYKCARPDLKFPDYQVRFPERINDYHGDCFAAIRAKDIVVHHPYESFDVVVRFLQQAADDPDVVSIKQTLYRTSHDSPIVAALIRAAENGKQVTALVELKARFDEEANIRLARSMERAGVQVVYGFVKYKTHAKISLVVRREQRRLRSYAHFGTGNYHPATAKVYTDLSFFTDNTDLCRDASYLFNYVTGYARPKRMRKLTIAPLYLRENVAALIDDEIAHAKAGRPAAIWAKMNALIDPDMIDKLYEASAAGVQIDLIVRGICGLRPGVKGLSENIRVKSIVGRFLEHARVYCFGAGQAIPSPESKLFIASADWMPRNFDHRIEVMVPVENETVHAQILDQILIANLKDNQQSWLLQPDGTYERMKPGNKAPFCAHDYFMEHPSLSGRGRALKKGRTPTKIG